MNSAPFSGPVVLRFQIPLVDVLYCVIVSDDVSGEQCGVTCTDEEGTAGSGKSGRR